MKQSFWRDPKRQRAAILALGLVCFALIVHEIFGEHGYLALRRQRRDLNELQQQIEQLQKDNQQLESQIKALKSDPKAIEKQAREQLHMAHPGELIFTLPEKKPEGENHPAAARDTQPK